MSSAAMAHEIELILMRELASQLAVPVFLVNPAGDLLFYNEPAEVLLGSRFDETGALPVDRWARDFEPVTDDGTPIAPEGLPLVQTLAHRRPAHGSFWITGMDGTRRLLEVTALPLVGQSGLFVGAAALFWEAEPQDRPAP